MFAYRITYADRETGREGTITVSAPGIEDAKRQAYDAGLVVSDVTQLAPDFAPKTPTQAVRKPAPLQGDGRSEEQLSILIAELQALRRDTRHELANLHKSSRILRRPRMAIVEGMLLFSLCMFGVGLVCFAVWQRMEANAERHSRLRALGIDPAADAEWSQLWPTLTFPTVPEHAQRLHVVTAHDEFTDYTTFETTFSVRGRHGEYRLTISTSEKGKVRAPTTPPRAVTIGQGVDGFGEFIIIADDERIEVARRAFAGVTLHDLPTAGLLKIVNARAVKARLNGVEVVFDRVAIERLKAFASILKQ
ncbi:MAG: hypothetical protein KF768_14045 [Phycisphaeraceae bacterium]|nr:hypothetical protein [Phycisphaeraceae bacterium]